MACSWVIGSPPASASMIRSRTEVNAAVIEAAISSRADVVGLGAEVLGDRFGEHRLELGRGPRAHLHLELGIARS